MKKHLLLFAALCIALSAGGLVSGFAADGDPAVLTISKLDKDTPAGWFDELDKAQAFAEKEKKPLLLFFTGSDWCPWCVKLHEDVLDKAEFKKYAEENLVLVYLDYPNKKKLPEALAKQNAPLPDRFKVAGYPCSVLVSADLKTEYGRISGYSEQFLSKVKGYVDVSKGTKTAADVEKKATIDDLKKLFDYLPESIGTIGTEKISRADFLDYLVGNDMEVVTAIAKDKAQVKELIESALKLKAVDRLVAKSGLKADADMFRTLLKKQCDIMPPADKDKLQKSIKENGFKNLDAFIEENVKKQDGNYEDVLQTAFKFNLAETIAQSEMPKITDKEIKDFYDRNQAACTVDGKVLPLDTPLKATIKKIIAMRKAAEKVPEKLKADIEALKIKPVELK